MKIRRVEGKWMAEVVAPGWPELGEVTMRFETTDQAEPTGEQVAEVERVVNRAAEVREQVFAALAAHAETYWMQELGVDEEIAASAGGDYFGRLQGVVVWPPQAGSVRVGFDFESLADENEHGVGVLWAADRVLAVGSSEAAQP